MIETKYCYIKNEFVLEENASISIKDRGFRFGDGVFETILIFNNIPYNFSYHLSRLQSGLSDLKIDFDISTLEPIATKLIKKNNQSSGFLRICITRGEGSKGYLPCVENGANLVIETIDKPNNKPNNIKLFISDIKRPNNHFKSKTMQGLSYSMARMQAQENNCFEAIMLNENGFISECSSSNIFWVKNDEIFTPSDECGLVAGSIRERIATLSPYKINYGEFKLDDLTSANEIFITNIANLALQVDEIKSIDLNLKNDNVTNHLNQLLQEDIKKQCKF